MKTYFYLTILAIALGSWQGVKGQDLVYKPINPAFGGDSFNYQWLLSSAQEQNDFKETADYSFQDQDPLTQFEQDLNRQILSQLSRRLVTDVFGEEGLKDGIFNLGSFQIEISNSTDGVHINILNVSNGGETTIIVPYF
jgi:curli production assembly/transport component CsgF